MLTSSARFAALFSVLFSLSTFAAEATSPSTPAGTPATGSGPAPSLREANNQWSYILFLEGASKQAGVGLGFQTPLLWETLGFRADYTVDRLGVPGADPVTFSSADVGIKFQVALDSDAGMYPYLVENFHFYFPRESETTGSTLGFETDFGIEWRHNMTIWGGQKIPEAVFIEVGMSSSELRAQANRGGNTIGDGHVARLGFRRFF